MRQNIPGGSKKKQHKFKSLLITTHLNTGPQNFQGVCHTYWPSSDTFFSSPTNVKEPDLAVYLMMYISSCTKTDVRDA